MVSHRGLAYGHRYSPLGLAEMPAGFTLGGGTTRTPTPSAMVLIGCSSTLRPDSGEAVTTDIDTSLATLLIERCSWAVDGDNGVALTTPGPATGVDTGSSSTMDAGVGSKSPVEMVSGSWTTRADSEDVFNEQCLLGHVWM